MDIFSFRTNQLDHICLILSKGQGENYVKNHYLGCCNSIFIGSGDSVLSLSEWFNLLAQELVGGLVEKAQ